MDQSNTFVDYLLQHSLQRGDQIAIVDAFSSITFRELDEQSSCLAHYLIEQGVKKDEFVCISLPRRKEFIISALAIMRIGAAFVPVDLSYPKDRQQYMINDSGAKVIITEDFLANLDLNKKDQSITSINLCTHESVAYLIYTSGSSGKPKGVVTKQKSISSLISWNLEAFDFKKEDRHLASSSFSFVASIHDLFCPLASGATVHILEETLQKDLSGIYDYIVNNQINRIIASTPLASLLINTYHDLELDYIQMGGEKMMPLRKTSAKIINIYGSTETTSCAIYHIVDQEKDVNIPIGRSVPGLQAFICDENGAVVPQGDEGELLLCGEQICEGYWRDDELTSQKFINSPLVEGKKVFKTGDIVRMNSEGEIEYIGRIDNQVKIRGFRIELNEIENIALLFYGTKSVVATVITTSSNVQELCLYYTAIMDIDKEQFRKFLANKLPEYMIPNLFIQLESMPLTPNGKINVKELPIPGSSMSRKGRIAVTELEKMFVNIFKSILGLDIIYADDNFFEIGGTSLTAIRIVIAAEDEGLKLTYTDVFECKSAEKLAALFEERNKIIKSESQIEDISDYDYSAINNLLKSNTLENFLISEKQEFKNVLLLGATGYLGIHLFHELIVHHPETHITCLIRPNDRQDGYLRLRSAYNYYFGVLSLEFAEERITVIEGDVSNSDAFNELLNYQIDTVFNSAANVKHFSPSDDISKVNYEGALRIIDFCKKSSARLIHISTISVSGYFFGYHAKDMQYRENSLFVGQKQISKYTQSKYLAERAILQAAAQGDISAKIMRVGNLSPRAADGKFQINASSNSFMSRVKSTYIIGAHTIEEEYMDLEFSPIDLTSKAILLLANTPKENVVFHPFNNYKGIMGDLYDCMNDVQLYTRAVNYDEYVNKMKAARKNPEIASLFTSLLAYDYDDKQEAIPLIASANFTQRVLTYLGFQWPALQETYVKQFLSVLREIGFFKISGK